MAIYALTGNDDLFINDVPINDLTDGSTVTITFPNEKMGTSTGKNGNKQKEHSKENWISFHCYLFIITI